jgi:hypothetical protein
VKAIQAALLAGAAVSVVAARSEACAGCSNPNLPAARGDRHALAPTELTLALNLTATTMHVVHAEACPEIGPICAERAEPPQLHDQRFYVAELRPILAFGISEWLGAELQLPVRVVKTTIVFRRLDGTRFEPDYQNIHHRDETLYGFADPWLLGRSTWTRDALTLTGRAGLGIPLGSTEEDPFARGRAGLSHQHIQFGTGTLYPVLALDAELRQGALGLSGYGQALLFLYENQHGYRAGNRFMGGLAAELQVVPRLWIGAGGDVLNEQPERWQGVVQQDGNVGRTDVLVGGTLRYAFGAVTASASVKVPVYQHFIDTGDHEGDASQLTYPAIVNLAVQTSFGALGERDRASY